MHLLTDARSLARNSPFFIIDTAATSRAQVSTPIGICMRSVDALVARSWIHAAPTNAVLDFVALGRQWGSDGACRVTRGLAFLEDDRLGAVETYEPSAVGPALVALRELTAQATRDVRITALLDVSMMARAAREEVRRRGAAIGGGV